MEKKSVQPLNAESQHQTRKDNGRYQKKKMSRTEKNKQQMMLFREIR